MTLEIASAQVVETSVANNSPSQDSSHPDDLFQSWYVTPGFKPFSHKHVFLRCFKVEAGVPEPAEIDKANVQSGVPERNSYVFNLSNCSVVLATLLRSIVVVVFISALKAMHVGVLRGEHFFNILQGDINSNFPLGEYYQSRSPMFHSKPPAAFKIVANKRGLFNIIWLGEQRKASHAKNKH